MVGAWRDAAEDHVEAKVVRRRVLIQTRFKVRRHCVIDKIHGAPFDVEDAVRRDA